MRSADAATANESTALSASGRGAAIAVPPRSTVATTAADDYDAIRKRVAALAHVRRATAAVPSRSSRAIAATAVETSVFSRSVTADVYDQLLSRGDRDIGVHTAPMNCENTRAFSTASNNLELPHARWHREVLRRARVTECFMVRKTVRGTACRQDAPTRAGTAASRKHGNDHAET
jgi:hypothetical protein